MFEILNSFITCYSVIHGIKNYKHSISFPVHLLTSSPMKISLENDKIWLKSSYQEEAASQQADWNCTAVKPR